MVGAGEEKGPEREAVEEDVVQVLEEKEGDEDTDEATGAEATRARELLDEVKELARG